MKKGFTLIEVLIAMSLFTVVAVIATNVLVDVVQLQKKSSIQSEIFDDARVIMQQLTNEIQSGTIDYEEYYSNYVVQTKKPVLSNTKDRYYGINYGVYASRFYDPGKSLYGPTTNPDDLGIECSQLTSDKKDCEIYFSDSADLNTGQNPYKGNKALYGVTKANALCDDVIGAPVAACSSTTNNVDQLFLIDSYGIHKTILGLKQMTLGNCGTGAGDCAIGMVKMTGRDLDQNGSIDIFSCDSGYNCFTSNNSGDKISQAIQYPFVQKQADPQKYLMDNNVSLPQKSDLSLPFDIKTTQFIPITPKHVTIKSLKFRINPLEDPYKAFSETAVQTQPTVGITMVLGLSKDGQKDYPGTFKDVTIETTISAGVIGSINSYPPVNDVANMAISGALQKGKSWIYNVFN